MTKNHIMTAPLRLTAKNHTVNLHFRRRNSHIAGTFFRTHNLRPELKAKERRVKGFDPPYLSNQAIIT